MATDDLTRRPSAQEHYRYIVRFLLILIAVFGGLGATLLGYNTWTQARAGDAQALLDGTPDATPDATAMKQAFEILETPHLFGGWHVPDHLWRDDHGILGGVDEELLAAAFVGAETLPGFKPLSACGKTDLLCRGTALNAAHDPRRVTPYEVRWYNYLVLRRAMARGEEMTATQLRFFQWNRALWVRAFRRQVMDEKGTPTPSDAVIMRDLQDNLDGASHNGLVFGGYGVIAGLWFGLVLFLWRRWHRPKEAEAVG